MATFSLYLLSYLLLSVVQCRPQSLDARPTSTSFIPRPVVRNLTIDDQSGLLSYSGAWMHSSSASATIGTSIWQSMSTMEDLNNGTYSASSLGRVSLSFSNDGPVDIYINCFVIPDSTLYVTLGQYSTSYINDSQPNATCASISNVQAGVKQNLTLNVSPKEGNAEDSIIFDSIIFAYSGNISFPQGLIPPISFTTPTSTPSMSTPSFVTTSPGNLESGAEAAVDSLSQFAAAHTGGSKAWLIILAVIVVALLASLFFIYKDLRRPPPRRNVSPKGPGERPTDSVTTLVNVPYY